MHRHQLKYQFFSRLHHQLERGLGFIPHTIWNTSRHPQRCMLTIWPWRNHIHATNTSKCPDRCSNLMQLNRRCLNTYLYIDSDVTFWSLWFQSPLLKYISIKWYLFALFIFWLMGGECCITYKTKFRRVDFVPAFIYYRWLLPSLVCMTIRRLRMSVFSRTFLRGLYQMIQ